MSYSFWRPQPWRPGALAPLCPPSYATGQCICPGRNTSALATALAVKSGNNKNYIS